MKINPFIHIFMNRKTGRFAILEFAIDRNDGLVVGTGDLVWVEPSEMRDQALDLVTKHIGRFDTAQSREGGSEFQKMIPTQRRKFAIQHKNITVEKRDETSFLLEPTRRDRGGWLGCPDESVVVSLPVSNGKFFEVLRATFERSQ